MINWELILLFIILSTLLIIGITTFNILNRMENKMDGDLLSQQQNDSYYYCRYPCRVY